MNLLKPADFRFDNTKDRRTEFHWKVPELDSPPEGIASAVLLVRHDSSDKRYTATLTLRRVTHLGSGVQAVDVDPSDGGVILYEDVARYSQETFAAFSERGLQRLHRLYDLCHGDVKACFGESSEVSA